MPALAVPPAAHAWVWLGKLWACIDCCLYLLLPGGLPGPGARQAGRPTPAVWPVGYSLFRVTEPGKQ